MPDRRVERARRAIGKTVGRILAGELSYLDGARVFLSLRAEAELADDADFEPFGLLRSETEHLPIGPQRSFWDESAVERKKPEIQRAEEWAREFARNAVERIASRFGAQAERVTTIEILMRRMLQRGCGRECVEWAIGMVEQGYESRPLFILAGLDSPLNHFEIAQLRDRVLEELRPPELLIDDPVNAYVAETLFDALYDRDALRGVFASVAQLATELGLPSDLQPVYLLHFAAEDLVDSDMQWYWDGATRQNIDALMREEARRFIARYAR